ncbi:MAG: HAMP domain-containing protein [Alphaproteobacteria bacterium]
MYTQKKNSSLSKLNNLRLSIKIPLAIAGFSLICGGAATYVGLNELKSSSENATKTAMFDKLYAKEAALQSFIENITGDLHALADNPYIISATNDFTNAWRTLESNQTKYLQNLYINQNPHETEKKYLLDAANDGSEYSQIHAKYHPYLREFLLENGYYDLFIVDASGNVVYSAYKELDFATNLKNGEWKDSGLAQVYTSIMAQKDAENISFADFTPYAPSANAPAGFIGRPIEDTDGNYIGALIYQMPIDKLNAVFNDDQMLGKTGKIMIVGQDFLLRNDVRFAKEPTILKVKVDSEEVKKALAKNSGVDFNTIDMNGSSVVSAYDNFDFIGTNYALLYQIDNSEIMGPLELARQHFLMLTGGIVLLIGGFGALFARGITRRINSMSNTMGVISKGDNTEVEFTENKDEIGDMARTVEIVRQNVVENTRLKLALDNASANMMIVDENLNIVYLNPAVSNFLSGAEKDI